MTKWIERYRRQAEERFVRLDALLDRMNGVDDDADTTTERDAGWSSSRHQKGILATTSTRYPQAAIEADPKVPVIRITRDFRGTPAQLLKAHTDPELFVRWVGRTPSRRRSSTGTCATAEAGGTSRETTTAITASVAASFRLRGQDRADLHLEDARRCGAGNPVVRGPR